MADPEIVNVFVGENNAFYYLLSHLEDDVSFFTKIVSYGEGQTSNYLKLPRDNAYLSFLKNNAKNDATNQKIEYTFGNIEPGDVNKANLENLLDVNIDGFSFRNLFYSLLNAPEQITNPDKPSILLHWGADGNIGWLRISADGQSVTMAPGTLGLGQPPQPFSLNDLGISEANSGNVFYFFLGPSTASLSYTVPTELPTGLVVTATGPVVTATGAPCSIVPKNFNLF